MDEDGERKEREKDRVTIRDKSPHFLTWKIRVDKFHTRQYRNIAALRGNYHPSPPPTTRYFIIRVSSIERSTDPIPPLMVVDGRWRRWVFSSSCHDTVWSRTLACLPACLFARSLVENITVHGKNKSRC